MSEDNNPIVQWKYGGFFDPRNARKFKWVEVGDSLMLLDQHGNPPPEAPTLPEGLDVIPEIDAYRIKTDRWKRGWQAEWPYCLYACRAYTRRGVIRKARRWYKNGTDTRMYMEARHERSRGK